MACPRQAIIWTNDEILLIVPLGPNFREILRSYIFIQENAFENVVWKMADISSSPELVKAPQKYINTFFLGDSAAISKVKLANSS